MFRCTFSLIVNPATNQAHPCLGVGHVLARRCLRIRTLYRARHARKPALTWVVPYCNPQHQTAPSRTSLPTHAPYPQRSFIPCT
jgi:hypothetical protein